MWAAAGCPAAHPAGPSTSATTCRISPARTYLLAARPDIDMSRVGLLGESMGGIQTLLMMTQHNSDAVLGAGLHFQAAVALYPICWLYNHVPGADFKDLVGAPVKIMVGDADDYYGGGDACKQLLSELAPADAAHVSLRVFPGATHIFDTFAGVYEFSDPGANRRHGGTIHVRPNPEATQQARDDLVAFFTAAFGSK